ncbi:MAG: DUF3108 domain-containing protein [Bacteroidales bacterium]|nr:DUF3108 domain-containing protein [Bacteroidales bacterium]
MKKILIAIMALGATLWASAYNFPDETISYKVMYKWGLINKKAGTVDIHLKNHDDRYQSVLTGASASWADKFFKVRDTLYTEMYKESLQPLRYEKIAHEGNDDKHDTVIFSYNGNTVTGQCTRLEKRDGKVRKDEQRTLEAEGETLDMLCSFYYMRNLPFEDWSPNHKVTVNIFSGKRKELLTIQYHGSEMVEYDNHKYDCYKITFIFTSDGKEKTSDDMYAWIDKTSRIPVKLEGKLPLGSIKCFYITD